MAAIGHVRTFGAEIAPPKSGPQPCAFTLRFIGGAQRRPLQPVVGLISRLYSKPFVATDLLA